MTEKNYRVETIDRADFSNDLEDTWTDLVARCENDHPFNTFSWLKNWIDSFDPDGQPFIIAVKKGGELCCVLPVLESVSGMAGFRSQWSWVNPFSFRSGLLCDPECLDAIPLLLEKLLRLGSWDRFDFYFSPSDTRVHAALVESAEQLGLYLRREEDMQSPVMALQGSWDEFLGAMSRRRRESERRKQKKLIEKNDGSVRIFNGSSDSLHAALKQCWEISRKTWKHADGTSIAAAPERMEFFENIALQNTDWIVLPILYIAGKPIAFEFNLLYNGCLYNLKLGYDEAYRNLSPGQVLRFNMIEWSFENGVRKFDFMGHAADYKVAFSDEFVRHETLYLYSKSWRGRVASIYQSCIRPALRRVKQLLVWQKVET